MIYVYPCFCKYAASQRVYYYSNPISSSSVSLFMFLIQCNCVCVGMAKSIYLSIYMSICLSVYPSFYFSPFPVIFQSCLILSLSTQSLSAILSSPPFIYLLSFRLIPDISSSILHSHSYLFSFILPSILHRCQTPDMRI